MNHTEKLTPPRGELGGKYLSSLGRRELTAVGRLVASGDIGAAELMAAERWLATYEIAEHGVVKSAGGHSTGVKLFDQERRAAAITLRRQDKQALGERGDTRLQAMLVNGLSANEIGRRTGCNDQVSKGKIVADLERLAEHYTKSRQPRQSLN